MVAICMVLHALVALSLGILLAPPAAEAQGAKVPRIGMIRPGSPPDPNAEAFLKGLRDLGYVEGKNIAIEYRWAQGKSERIAELTAELVRLNVDLIFTTGQPGAVAARRATSTIPIVAVMADAAGAGLVASLARPGGNLTGLSMVNPELSEKRMQLLKEAFPRLSRVALLRDPTQSPTELSATDTAARILALQLHTIELRDISGLNAALAAARRERAGALNVMASPVFFAHRTRIVEAVAKAHLPAIYQSREFVAVGGLMAYGPNFPDLLRRAAAYVDKILKGTKPSDLPVEQPTTFEFVVNLKTAKALGVTIPQPVLFRADHVIQ